jgi:putative membrane protein
VAPQQENTDMKSMPILCATFLVLACGATSAWAAGPTDAQIAAIVVTANQVDIDAGTLAKSKAHSKDVKEFAQRMITDHSGVNKSATELVEKLHVTPEPSPTSESLQKGPSTRPTSITRSPTTRPC